MKKILIAIIIVLLAIGCFVGGIFLGKNLNNNNDNNNNNKKGEKTEENVSFSYYSKQVYDGEETVSNNSLPTDVKIKEEKDKATIYYKDKKIKEINFSEDKETGVKLCDLEEVYVYYDAIMYITEKYGTGDKIITYIDFEGKTLEEFPEIVISESEGQPTDSRDQPISAYVYDALPIKSTDMIEVKDNTVYVTVTRDSIDCSENKYMKDMDNSEADEGKLPEDALIFVYKIEYLVDGTFNNGFIHTYNYSNICK